MFFGHLLTHLAMTYREFKLNGNSANSQNLQKMLQHVVYDIRIMIETAGGMDSFTICYAIFNMVFEMFEKISSGQIRTMSEFLQKHSIQHLKDNQSLR